MAALPKPAWNQSSLAVTVIRRAAPAPVQPRQLIEFSGVFRGHELTRKDRRLGCAIAPLDALLQGGIARGRISEIIGRRGSGRTSLAAAFAASATRRSEVAAWIDGSGAFDPASIAAAGVDLARILWASIPRDTCTVRERWSARGMSRAATPESRVLKAAELVLEAGGFGLVVVDFGDTARTIPGSAALRLARAAERSGAAVIVIAARRMCGTFAALSLVTHRIEAFFSRPAPAAPALFDALMLEAEVTRNKLGGLGRSARVAAVIDPQDLPFAARIETRAPAVRIAAPHN
jgi:recA bacterial DNA recombination protein